jgi:hypothetical protein
LDNLKLFLINIHAYLKSQRYQFMYTVLVVEQANIAYMSFNKGRLYNAAVQHIIDNMQSGGSAVDCVVLHDVDLVPANSSDFLGERGDYRCRKMPWHLSRKLWLQAKNLDQVYNQFLTGGILSLRLGHFTAVNGFSNEYFGWGAEDVNILFCN